MSAEHHAAAGETVSLCSSGRGTTQPHLLVFLWPIRPVDNLFALYDEQMASPDAQPPKRVSISPARPPELLAKVDTSFQLLTPATTQPRRPYRHRPQPVDHYWHSCHYDRLTRILH
jgi:hypothetical protein